MKSRFISLLLAVTLTFGNTVLAEEITSGGNTALQMVLDEAGEDSTSGSAFDDTESTGGSGDTADTETSGSAFNEYDIININRIAYVSDNESIEDVYLKIVPRRGIDFGDTITVSISSGSFDAAALEEAAYVSGAGNDYDVMMELCNSGLSVAQVLSANLGNAGLKLPYKYVSIGEKELKIELFPIDEADCGQSSNSVAYDIPYYYIPLKAVTGSENITVEVDTEGVDLPKGFNTVLACVNNQHFDVEYTGGDTVSVNSENVSSGEAVEDIYLYIEPQYGIELNSIVTVKLYNGTFDKPAMRNLEYISGAGNNYYNMMDLFNSGMSLTQVLNSNLGTVSGELPYRIVDVWNDEITVELFPIEERDCGKENNPVSEYIPYYRIPLIFTAGDYDVSVGLEPEQTALPHGFEAIAAYVDGGTPAPTTEATTETTTEEQDGIYPVEGGNIYYNMEGRIIDCDPEVVNVVIPDRADGVRISDIADSAFSGCNQLKSVYISDSVINIGYGAFMGCTSLTDVRLSSNLYIMGKSAFENCTSLEKVEIPLGVETIETETFRNCTSLKEVIIPESVSYVGSYAFAGCTAFTEVTLPDIGFGKGAFQGCSGLKSVEINKGYLSEDLFRDCVNLTDVSFSADLEIIDSGAFANCTALTNITLPEGLVSIEYYAFADCTGLKDVALPDSLTRIENYAFKGCTSLREILIPEGVEYVGESAFDNCYYLTNINAAEENEYYSSIDGVLLNKDKTTLVQYPDGRSGEYVIPEGVTSVGLGAFTYHDKLTGITIPSSMEVIPRECFSYCGALYSVVISEGVTDIGQGAFRHCSSLNDLSLPEGLTDLGDEAFLGCAALESTELPSTIKRIGYSTFEGCSSLSNIVIPEGTEIIDARAFYYCTSLSEIILPQSITFIGADAFIGCSSLTRAELPQGITSLPEGIFYGCSALTDVKFSENLEYIEPYAFYNCGSLKSITIPIGVTNIGFCAFTGCKNLTDIYYGGCQERWNTIYIEDYNNVLNSATIHYNPLDVMPTTETTTEPTTQSTTEPTTETTTEVKGKAYPVNGGNIYYNAKGIITGCDRDVVSAEIPNEIGGIAITTIGDRAFYNCGKLESIEFSEGLTDIGYGAFALCGGLRSIALPDSVTSISESAFSGCSSLQEVKLPDGLIKIGDYAFAACSALKSVTIPEGTMTVGNYVFMSCNELTNAEIPSAVGYIGTGAFNNCNKLSAIFVYKDSYAEMWAKGNGFNVEYLTLPFNFGDSNADSKITAADAAEVLQKVLDASFVTGIEKSGGDYMTVLDVSADGKLTAEDASQILQKTLDNSYTMPCEE